MTEHKTFADALAAFQAEMPTVEKRHTAKMGTYSYTYADLADVSAAATPLLAKHGLAFTCTPEVRDTGVTVLRGTLMHATGSVAGELPIKGNTPQDWGSWVTYMRRYLLGCLTGIVTDEDDDAAGVSAPARKDVAQHHDGRPPHGQPFPTKPASEAQVKLIGVLMSKLGMSDRGHALAFVVDVIGRQVESRNELTSPEATKVIDALKRDLGEE